MAHQSTYLDRMPLGFAGMIATQSPSTLVSYLAEAAIPFGRALKQGTADNEADLADNASDNVLGISVREHSTGETDEFGIGENVRVMTEGEIFVTAGGTATAGTPVYMIPASGKFVTSATDNLAISGATFVDSGVADGLVRIRLK